MDQEWSGTQPIYRQVRPRVAVMIMEGGLKEGDALPSVRLVAAESRINPLTVMKGYQSLADEGLVEKRRGLGLFVKPGARDLLLKAERGRFLDKEWPEILATIQRLGLSLSDLPQSPTPPHGER